jgi:hypothetical protein
MAEQASSPSIAISRKPWVIALLLALLWHVAWLLPHIPWTSLSAPPRVEIHTIDPAKLDAIRRSWDKKQLLLDRDKSHASEKEPPKDARYFSDKNRTVEKEQRAKDFVTVPKAGRNVPEPSEAAKQAKSRPAKPKTPERHLPSLGNLGVPLPPPKPQAPETAGDSAGQASKSVETPGGQQFVKDPNVPEGSENLLNSQESVYYSFYARLYDAIAPIWQSRLRELPPHKILQGDYTTVVDVVFDRDGGLIGVERNQASGVEEFDRIVDEAWKQVGRFPNPPTGLLDSSGQVHTGWAFTVRIRGGMPFELLPPERNY